MDIHPVWNISLVWLKTCIIICSAMSANEEVRSKFFFLFLFLFFVLFFFWGKLNIDLFKRISYVAFFSLIQKGKKKKKLPINTMEGRWGKLPNKI